jgi:hypothetical protein
MDASRWPVRIEDRWSARLLAFDRSAGRRRRIRRARWRAALACNVGIAAAVTLVASSPWPVGFAAALAAAAAWCIWLERHPGA